MDIFAEQFIPSNKSYKASEITKKVSIVIFILALFMIFSSLIITVALIILGIVLFLISMFNYVEYEYEFFDGTLSVTRIFNMSRRKVAIKIDKHCLRKAYIVRDGEVNNKRIKKFYNTSIENLQKYNFELNNGKIVQLALNDELSKLVNIYLK
ncbi:hypothetical protein [Clostridium weizhouense]|uniref:DUF5673 domain-containing protein n=1 Tax=Clostridium weizhouense TaxID=2859781 RepID=A0ABS7AS67_9CLOT|nr:hypothetical protein [Clostridium weizhouense]MBW6411509.1 hypothetical protein [Clostridium weizhouense]